MWPTILLSVAVFAVAFVGMAIGVIISNRRIRGSCGGLAETHDSDGNIACEACTNPSPTCSGNPDDKSAIAEDKIGSASVN